MSNQPFDEQEISRVNVAIPSEVLTELKILAVKQKRTLSEITAQAFREFMQSQEAA